MRIPRVGTTEPLIFAIRRRAIFLICAIIGHRRSKSRAYFVPQLGKWRSFCKRCGTPLIREDDGTWHKHEW